MKATHEQFQCQPTLKDGAKLRKLKELMILALLEVTNKKRTIPTVRESGRAEANKQDTRGKERRGC